MPHRGSLVISGTSGRHQYAATGGDVESLVISTSSHRSVRSALKELPDATLSVGIVEILAITECGSLT
jgi:hypothetical protein